MDTVSIFNKTVKALLVDLKEWAPADAAVKWLRKTYMEKKTTDPKGPMDVFVDFVKTPEHREAILNRDDAALRDSTHRRVQALRDTMGKLEGENKDKVWEYLNTLVMLTDTMGTLSNESIATIETIAKECASDMKGTQEKVDIGAMIAKTTQMMPQVFKQLGMDVSEEEIQGAAEHIQNSNMLSIFSKLMASESTL